MNTKNRRAVSPVIATVILVAVAITITIAVAYWMGGIAGGYTKFEKVEVTSLTCSSQNTSNVWTLTMKIKNTGSAPSTLTGAYINQFEVDAYSGVLDRTKVVCNMTSSLTLDPGAVRLIMFSIGDQYPPASKAGNFYTSGVTLNVKVHSAGGMDYIKIVELV